MDSGFGCDCCACVCVWSWCSFCFCFLVCFFFLSFFLSLFIIILVVAFFFSFLPVLKEVNSFLFLLLLLFQKEFPNICLFEKKKKKSQSLETLLFEEERERHQSKEEKRKKKKEKKKERKKRKRKMSLAEGKRAIEQITGERCTTVRTFPFLSSSFHSLSFYPSLPFLFPLFLLFLPFFSPPPPPSLTLPPLQFDLGSYVQKNPAVLQRMTTVVTNKQTSHLPQRFVYITNNNNNPNNKNNRNQSDK